MFIKIFFFVDIYSTISFICTGNIIIHTIMKMKTDLGAELKCLKLAPPLSPKEASVRRSRAGGGQG